MKATARLIIGIVRASAHFVSGIGASVGHATDATGLRKFLRVCPQEPQEVTWVRFEDTVEYHVESNTNWNIT